MSGKIVDINGVRIKTLTAQVRTITLGAKQMTLSVFRQLPERVIWRNLENDDFAHLGEPWGWVNCSAPPSGAARSLIWSDGEGLYRMPLWGVDAWLRVSERLCDGFVQGDFVQGELELARRAIPELRRAQGSEHGHLFLERETLEFLGLSLADAKDPARLDDALQWAERWEREMAEDWKNICACKSKKREVIEAECAAFDALPQLFIAV